MLLWLVADPRAICLFDGFKVDPPALRNKVHKRSEERVWTYPLRIGVLRFQVKEQLLRIPIKQGRKVYSSEGIECFRVGWK